MVARVLLVPVMWIYQTDELFLNIVHIVYDGGIYSSVVVFDFPYDFTLTADLEHSSVSLYYSLFNLSNWYNKVVVII